MNVTAEIRDDFPGRISIFAPYRVNEKTKSVPGTRWDKEMRRWSSPVSWVACLALRAEFSTDLEIGENLRAWATETGARKKQLASLRYLLKLPEGYEWAEKILEPYELRDYQKVDAVCMALAGRYMLLNGLGTGKSRSTLSAMKLLADMHGSDATVFPCAITAPKSVLRPWRNEIAHIFPDAVVNVVDSTPAKNKKLMEPGADFYILSWGAIRKWSRHAPYGSTKIDPEHRVDKEMQLLGLKTFIADEAHRVRNCESQQTRAAWSSAWSSTYRFELTGTLQESSCEDLYGPLHLIVPDEYPTKTSTLERFVDFEYDEFGGRVINGLKPEREEEFRANFDAVSRLITKETAAPFLPEKVFETRYVSLPPKLRKVYKDMKKDYMAVLTDGSIAATENQLTRASMLLRMANAELELDPNAPTQDADGNPLPPKYNYRMSPKVDQFMDDLLSGDFADAQIVVFAEFLGMLDLVAERLDKAKITWTRIDGAVTGDDRQKAIDTFQAGDARICLLSRAGGEGITLTAASVMVRIMRPWSYIVYTQVADRIHRLGSERHESILYVDYVTEDTIEEAQVRRIAEKGEAATDTLKPGELLEMLEMETT